MNRAFFSFESAFSLMVLALVIACVFSSLPENDSCVMLFAEQRASDFLIVSALEKSSPERALESAELFFAGTDYGLEFDDVVLKEVLAENFLSKKIVYYRGNRPVTVRVFLPGCS